MSSNNDTFADLDRSKGIDPLPVQLGEEMPLPTWYRSVYHTSIDQLTIQDLSKATRQRLHPERIIPLVIERLRENPLAGEFFDGELLVSLRSVEPDYWTTHRSVGKSLVDIIDVAWNDIPKDVKSDAKEILRVLDSILLKI